MTTSKPNSPAYCNPIPITLPDLHIFQNPIPPPPFCAIFLMLVDICGSPGRMSSFIDGSPVSACPSLIASGPNCLILQVPNPTGIPGRGFVLIIIGTDCYGHGLMFTSCPPSLFCPGLPHCALLPRFPAMRKEVV